MLSKSETLLAHLNSAFMRLKLLNFRNYISSFYNYYKTYRNFAEVLMHIVLNRFPIEATLRNGQKVILKDHATAYLYTKFKNLKINDLFIEFEYSGKIVRLYGLKHGDLSWKYGDLATIFISRDYDILNVKDKVVIDIGANVGDTPVYFALRGARKVIAFEPFPYLFSLAKKNVEENGLQDRVILVNAGCGYDGKVRVREDVDPAVDIQLVDYGTGIEIPIYSLNSIVKMFNIENAVLKVDCEGCEYELFKGATNETLSKFEQIMIEYHYGYKELVKRLKEANFKVKFTIPKFNKDTKMIIGYIFAWRQ